MDIDALLSSLQDAGIPTLIRENGSVFPWVESVHVLALTAVVGSVAWLDLRLLGWVSRSRPVTQVVADVLPSTWIAFGVAVVTGLLLFASNALSYAHNPYFRAKLLFLLMLGVNTSVFHFGAGRVMADWDAAATPPRLARVAGAVSLVLWIGVTICGRWIGFTRALVSP